MTTRADVHAAMEKLWADAGGPPFRRLAKLAGVPVSAAHTAVRGPGLVQQPTHNLVAAKLGELAGRDPGDVIAMWPHVQQKMPRLPSVPRRTGLATRRVFIVLDADLQIHAFVLNDDLDSAVTEARRLGGLVVQLPVVADFTRRGR